MHFMFVTHPLQGYRSQPSVRGGEKEGRCVSSPWCLTVFRPTERNCEEMRLHSLRKRNYLDYFLLKRHFCADQQSASDEDVQVWGLNFMSPSEEGSRPCQRACLQSNVSRMDLAAAPGMGLLLESNWITYFPELFSLLVYNYSLEQFSHTSLCSCSYHKDIMGIQYQPIPPAGPSILDHMTTCPVPMMS